MNRLIVLGPGGPKGGIVGRSVAGAAVCADTVAICDALTETQERSDE